MASVVIFFFFFHQVTVFRVFKIRALSLAAMKTAPLAATRQRPCDQHLKSLTCAAMSISLFSFSFLPSSVFRKSRRQPASQKRRSTTVVTRKDRNIFTVCFRSSQSEMLSGIFYVEAATLVLLSHFNL